MNQEEMQSTNDNEIPASLRRGKKEPTKNLHVCIPLSWWKELKVLAQEYDQDVSVFLREAIEDWLRRARKVHQSKTSNDKRDDV